MLWDRQHPVVPPVPLSDVYVVRLILLLYFAVFPVTHNWEGNETKQYLIFKGKENQDNNNVENTLFNMFWI